MNLSQCFPNCETNISVMNLTKGVRRYTTVDKQNMWQVLSLQRNFS